ncbi:MAG: radical SAM protein [Myxococcota bacterium]
MRERAGSIYIHIPFCRDRCFYCDFYSTKYNESSQLIQDYLESIIMEFEVYREFVEERIKTIYIGGGTPSIIPVKHIDSFLKSFLKKIELLDGYEFTFEMNPESVDKGLLKLLKWYGVNRISLGAQSQNDSILKALNRAHNVSDTYTSLTDIFECGFENVSVDFLIGTTKETEEFIDEIYRLTLKV